MVLVFGGTTEGKIIAKMLEEEGIPYFYSTKTGMQSVSMKLGTAIQGGMDAQEMKNFCCDQKIDLILNGSHPFASLLHQTIAEVAASLEIPVYRLERNYDDTKAQEGIVYQEDFQQATQYLLKKRIPRLLALTGVQTIPKLEKYWRQYECYFRILNSQESLEKAQKSGFPEDHLICSTPGNDVELEMELIRRISPDAILTKESGTSGFFTTKLKAALRCDIPFLVVKRPPLPSSFQVVQSIDELRKKLVKSRIK